jgi:hypothetical protein
MYTETVRHRRSAYPGHAIELARVHEGIRAYGLTEEEVAARSMSE